MSQFQRELQGGDLAPNPEDARLAKILAEYRIGGAFVHAFGVGHVAGVVDLRPDPNARANPRPLRSEHVSRLVRIFTRHGEKRDHYSPIYIMVPVGQIPPDTLAQIKAADPREPAVHMPSLRLSNPNASEIAELEKACLTFRLQDQWVEEHELESMRTRLDTLRAQSPKAMLLNGNHRIRAIEDIGNQAYDRYRAAHFKLRRQEIGSDESKEQMDLVAQLVQSANYRVEVYNSENIPQELVSYLVRNEETRLAKGFETGEKTWWTANRFENAMKRACQTGTSSVDDRFNAAQSEWLKEAGAAADQEGPRGLRLPGHQRGDGLGDEPTARLYLEPLTTRMVLDTKNALVVYDSVFKTSHAIAMLKSSGALLVCQFWLSVRVLLSVFDVARGRGFEEAENFLEANPIVSPDGYEAAVPLWDSLHCCPQERLPYLEYFTPEVQNSFNTLYESALQATRSKGNLQWDGEDLALSARKVFEDFGRWISSRKPTEVYRRIATSTRLFSRLPLYNQNSRSSPAFYPSSAFPATQWIESAMEVQVNLKTDTGLQLLEYLIDPFLPIWTIGAQTAGKSANSANWYRRSRGLHQLAMRLLDAPESTTESQLSEAIKLLGDARLPLAMQTAQTMYGARVRSLMDDCCVWRKSNVQYSVLKELCVKDPAEFGTYRDLHAEVSSLRTDIQSVASSAIPANRQPTRTLGTEYPRVQHLVGTRFFAEFDINGWISGWNAAEARKAQNAGSLVGWAILTERLKYLVVECMAESRELLYLARTVERMSLSLGQSPWWTALEIDSQNCIKAVSVQPKGKEKSVKARQPARVAVRPTRESLEHTLTSDNETREISAADEAVLCTGPVQQNGQSGPLPAGSRDNTLPRVNTLSTLGTEEDDCLLNDANRGDPACLSPMTQDLNGSEEESLLAAALARLAKSEEETVQQALLSIPGTESVRAEASCQVLEERNLYRIGLVAVIQHCCTNPYGYYFASIGLRPMISRYKDAYVARIALIFQDVFGMTEEDSLEQSGNFTWADKLFRLRVQLNAQVGYMKADLIGCMAEDSSIYVGRTTVSDPGERDRVVNM
ncbi:hypothetical protein FRC09_012217, partial [Ceratobasidium sp. 395]